MSFPTLESRFRASGSSLYKRFSNPELTEQILPDSKQSRSNIKNDSRLLPIESTKRDVSRLTNFIKSDRGKLYIGKQLLLQTGNAFAESRLYNPLSPIVNAVPTLHAVRQLGRPILNILTPTRDNRGALQEETLNSFKTTGGNPLTRLTNQLVNAALSPIKALLTTPKLTSDNQFYLRPEDDNSWYPRLLLPQDLSSRGKPSNNIKSWNDVDSIIASLKSSKPSLKIPLVHNYRYANNLVSYVIFPELTKDEIQNTYVSFLDGKGALQLNGSKFRVKVKGDTVLATAYTKDNGLRNQQKKYSSQEGKDHAAFVFLEDKNNSNGYFYGKVGYQRTPEADNSQILRNPAPTIGDSFNPENTQKLYKRQYSEGQQEAFKFNRLDYTFLYDVAPKANDGSEIATSDLLGSGYDIIRFIFRSVSDNRPMHFRGFISTIKENVKPEFSEQRYLGRTERFVNYGGAKRTVNLEFNIVAFSKNELDAMWARINYLTGLAFPKGVSESGFMIPPLFKITIGDIYEEQPCYIDNLDFVMLDESITFDIDREVSQVINVTLSLVILEKRSRYYNSPFYGITEKMAKLSSESFANSIEGQIPPPLPNFPVPGPGTLNVLDPFDLSAPLIGVVPTRNSYSSALKNGWSFANAAPYVKIDSTVPTQIDTRVRAPDVRMQQRMFLMRNDPEYYNPNNTTAEPMSLENFCKGTVPLLPGETCESFYTNKYLPTFYLPNDLPDFIGPPAP